jgi:electron-transferring-flavoprotein dehydrogenase
MAASRRRNLDGFRALATIDFDKRFPSEAFTPNSSPQLTIPRHKQVRTNERVTSSTRNDGIRCRDRGCRPCRAAAAIRIRQAAARDNRDVSVVVVEKGSEVGAHILSGVVVDPIGLDSLLPDWRNHPDCPLHTRVKEDRFLYLTQTGSHGLPAAMMPKLLDNHGNFIGSLGNVTRFLAARAEELGVEIFPGFAASELLLEDGKVVGVATGDMGIDRNGVPRADFVRGMELRATYTLLAEGARGSLSKQAIAHFDLDEGSDFQKFGIGIKELWQIDPARFQEGLVQHSFGWPLDRSTGGGSFLYHFDENLVAVGFVVHLNYSNPTLSPFEEFQRFKTHPAIRDTFAGGKRIAYGARALTEGGWQSVPRLTFPGGALLGCSAGFVNVPRIKGSHNAILSGIQAADAVVAELASGKPRSEPSPMRKAGAPRRSARISSRCATSSRSGPSTGCRWASCWAAPTCGATSCWASRRSARSPMASPTAPA